MVPPSAIVALVKIDKILLMKKFAAIEGMRGWLAWTVVFCHFAPITNMEKGLGRHLVWAGSYAVLVFIIISGFVITHLVTERSEPYRDYLLRRFMRIFPLFAVTCVIGFFTTNLCAETVSRSPWALDPAFDPALQMFTRWSHTIHDFFWPHVIAHITMLHGAISSNLLPDSPYAFNSPAWSISLEWQFYLIAPAVIMIARRHGAIIWFALLIALLEIAFRHGLFGKFDSPSFLPGAAGYFALGIASRLPTRRLPEASEIQTP